MSNPYPEESTDSELLTTVASQLGFRVEEIENYSSAEIIQLLIQRNQILENENSQFKEAFNALEGTSFIITRHGGENGDHQLKLLSANPNSPYLTNATKFREFNLNSAFLYAITQGMFDFVSVDLNTLISKFHLSLDRAFLMFKDFGESGQVILEYPMNRENHTQIFRVTISVMNSEQALVNISDVTDEFRITESLREFIQYSGMQVGDFILESEDGFTVSNLTLDLEALPDKVNRMLTFSLLGLFNHQNLMERSMKEIMQESWDILHQKVNNLILSEIPTSAFELNFRDKIIRTFITRNDQLGRVFIAFEDITTLYKEREELLKKAAYQILNEHSTEFIKGVSHHIRNLLSNLTTQTYLIKKKLSAGVLVPVDDKSFNIIDRNLDGFNELLKRMTTLNTFLRYNSIGPTAEELAAMDFESKKVNEIISGIKNFHLENPIEFKYLEINDKTRVTIDSKYFQQAMDEILNNAINSRNATRDLKIEVIVNKTPTEVEFIVKDNGNGIKNQMLNQVYVPFNTILQTSGDGHYGLGIPIASNIIQYLKGNLVIESREGEGTTVRISLPIISEG